MTENAKDRVNTIFDREISQAEEDVEPHVEWLKGLRDEVASVLAPRVEVERITIRQDKNEWTTVSATLVLWSDRSVTWEAE